MTDSKYLPSRKKALQIVAIVLVIGIVAPFAVFTVPQVVGADDSYVVVSSSMRPTIHANDAIIVNDVSPSSVQKGDIIVFDERNGGDSDGIDVTSHRVVDIINDGNGLAFETKGDANEDPDRGTVPASALVGRVAFTIPYIGYAVGFASTRLGFIVLVAVPLGLLVLSEIYDLAVAARNTRGEADGATETNSEDG